MQRPRDPGETGRLYLDLLQRCLTRYDLCSAALYRPAAANTRVKQTMLHTVEKALRGRGLELVAREHYDSHVREWGLDLPTCGETMVGLHRLRSLEECVLEVLSAGVPGDFLEAGAWRGGTAILMRAVLKTYHITDRKVFVADSFRGLPPPKRRYASDRGDRLWADNRLAVSLAEVHANFARYGLLDDQVAFIEGWFSESLKAAPIERLAVLRLDADMYESTLDALEALYPKLSPGGFVIVDDYGALESCRRAVHDYRDRNGISEPIESIDWTGVYWRRGP